MGRAARANGPKCDNSEHPEEGPLDSVAGERSCQVKRPSAFISPPANAQRWVCTGTVSPGPTWASRTRTASFSKSSVWLPGAATMASSSGGPGQVVDVLSLVVLRIHLVSILEDPNRWIMVGLDASRLSRGATAMMRRRTPARRAPPPCVSLPRR